MEFKNIKVYKLKENEKVLFPSVETWYIDVDFKGRKDALFIIGEVEDYFIKDGFVVADIKIYDQKKVLEGLGIIIEFLTPAISGNIMNNGIKLNSLSLCTTPNADPEIKNLKIQQSMLSLL